MGTQVTEKARRLAIVILHTTKLIRPSGRLLNAIRQICLPLPRLPSILADGGIQLDSPFLSFPHDPVCQAYSQPDYSTVARSLQFRAK